jgi:ArsR family transcriptional regulator, arsenate/arsenite/antimonite-responsive transcriptional repressor
LNTRHNSDSPYIDDYQYFNLSIFWQTILTCVNIESMKLSKPALLCCPPLLAGRLTSDEATYLAASFRVLSEPVRLQMLSLIAAQPSKEVCACELAEPLGLSQPTVSHHLKVMYEVGLLERERRGTWIYYRILPEKLAILRESLS